MRITFDPVERAATLASRGLDFADADGVFADLHATAPDERHDYGERRFISAGFPDGRLVVLVWTRVVAVGELFRSGMAMPRKPHVGKPLSADPDDAPELTEAFFAGANIYQGPRLIRRGRPKADAPKQQVTLRLDAAVVQGLRATGPGWQTRANQILKAFLEQSARRRATGAAGGR